MTKCALAFVASCLLAAGCAQNYVLSNDRPTLWAAAMTAVSESDFDIVRADEVKGLIVGTKSLMTDETVMDKERLQVTVDTTGGAYRALVTVKRTGPPVEYESIDVGIRWHRPRLGGTGRETNEYGTAARRDFAEEKAVLNRMRALLNPAAEAAPPATSP